MNLLTVTINLKTSWLVFTARLRPQFAVLFESSRIFLNTQETDAKNGPEFWIVILEFLKFSKRRCVVPLWPIWAIMVAAKLDHSRVLITKFQKIGQRWRVEVPVRDTQTDSIENKGPSGLPSGQKYSSKLLVLPTSHLYALLLHTKL